MSREIDINKLELKRGQVYLADLGETTGSEQGGIRPVLIVQNNKGNKYSGTTVVLTLTTKNKKVLPTHVQLSSAKYDKLVQDSIVLAEQVRTLDKSRFLYEDPYFELEPNDMYLVSKTIKKCFDIF